MRMSDVLDLKKRLGHIRDVHTSLATKGGS